jgi:4-oxalocrotonate tautomerase
MPHVIVKLWPGKSEAQKKQLAERIARDVMEVLGYGEESVSVAMEEVPARDWPRRSTTPTSRERQSRSTRSPGTTGRICPERKNQRRGRTV